MKSWESELGSMRQRRDGGSLRESCVLEREEQCIEDRICWSPTTNGNFKITSFCKVLSSRGSLSFLWKSIWRIKVPTKVAIFFIFLFFLRGQLLGEEF